MHALTWLLLGMVSLSSGIPLLDKRQGHSNKGGGSSSTGTTAAPPSTGQPSWLEGHNFEGDFLLHCSKDWGQRCAGPTGGRCDRRTGDIHWPSSILNSKPLFEKCETECSCRSEFYLL